MISVATDTVRGGSGSSDTLRVTYAGAVANAATPTISGFESMSVTTGTNDNAAQSFASTTGLTNITVGGTNGFTATGLATGVALTVGQASPASTFTVGGFTAGKTISFGQQTVTGTADSQTVNLVRATGSGTVTLALPGIETVNLNESSTAAATPFTLAVDTNIAGVANANSVTINLTGGVAGTQTDTEGSSATARNVSFASGGLQSNVSVLNASAYVNGALVMSPGSRLNASAMTITGTSGSDTIIMRNGSDVLTASTGTDTLVVSANAVIGGFAFDLNSTTDQVIQFAGSANAAAQTGFEYLDASLVSGNFGADITGRSAAVNSIIGTLNADNIVTGSANDTITGGAGGDTINVGSGTDRLLITATATGSSPTSAAQTATVSVSGNIISPVLGSLDVITGMGRGDQLQFTGANASSYWTGFTSLNFGNVGTVTTTPLSGSSNTNPVLVQGTYLTTGVFAISASGADLLLEWDVDGTGGNSVYEAVVFIGANTGFVSTSSTGSDSMTGIVATSAGILTFG